MASDKNKSVSIAGVVFKSPVLVSSSEATSSPELLKKIIDQDIGGVATKTFAGISQSRVRLRPYQFPLNSMGRGFRESGSLYSVASAHVEALEDSPGRIREMAGICRSASMVLLGSFYDDPEDISSWVKHACAFQDAGADMVELNFSSPSAARVFARRVEVSARITGEVKKRVSIPVGIKLSPTIEPLEELVEIWGGEGLDFITAHNAPSGIVIDVEKEAPFGAPAIGGYVPGRAFLPYSLGRVVRIKKASSIPVIGVGGIYDFRDAVQYILCGCHLVGVGSALYFRGSKVLGQICRGLERWMEKKGYSSIDEFRGKALPLIEDVGSLKEKEHYGFAVPPECPYLPVISEDKCNRCGLCERACIYGAIMIYGGRGGLFVDRGRCWSCGFCVGICPRGAIELRDKGERKRVIWNNQGTAEPFKPRVH